MLHKWPLHVNLQINITIIPQMNVVNHLEITLEAEYKLVTISSQKINL